jgi:predicted nucleic acid-binding protein
MIHLDTNLLIDLVTIGSPHIAVVEKWLSDGEKLGTSAIAWSEFCNGPHTKQQKDAVFAVLDQEVCDFTWKEAEQASRLFHQTGRRRGSHADCMIAASAILRNVPVATRNIKDFEKFLPYKLQLLPIPTQS